VGKSRVAARDQLIPNMGHSNSHSVHSLPGDILISYLPKNHFLKCLSIHPRTGGFEDLQPMAIRSIPYFHPMYALPEAQKQQGGCPFKKRDQSDVYLAES
jgi:hypothetical protein